MDENRPFKKMSRREFLVASGASLVVLAAGCKRLSQVSPQAVDTPLPPSSPPASPPTAPAEAAYPTAHPALVGDPDTILTNAKVYTIDSKNSLAEAVAIKDGLIQAVGDARSIAALAGGNTKVVDVKGRAVTPGLIDPHLHFRLVGLQNVYYTPMLPPKVKDTATLQAALAEEVKKHKPGEWIQAFYLVITDNNIPNKSVLDPVSPKNPVFLFHIGGHWGTANTVALKEAGITNSTPSPEGGLIEKDASGQLTGVLYNHRAMDVLRRKAPPVTEEMVLKSILDTQPMLASCGVTTFHDNNVRTLDQIQAYQKLSREGKMYLRHSIYMTLEWPQDINNVDKVEHYQDDFCRFAGFKFLIDGQLPTAYCHEPTKGVKWDMPTWDPDNFKQTVKTLHDTGLQISVHCFGDAATDLTLDAYEAAMKANPRSDPRHRIEHVILTKPQATRRMKDLGVVVSTNPHFLYIGGDAYQNYFGEQRYDRIMVTREWLDAGVHMTIGSDAPTTPFYTPQATMAGAISRLTLSKKALNPDQCMTIQEALRAHTIEAAYAGHEEKIKGSIEPGKLADLVVWQEDPTTLSIEKLFKTATVNSTIVGGKVVYQG